jgi:glycosyltransferase involved in cell wall biosynthesis
VNILLVVHDYPPADQGGAERRAARTARALSARGHRVEVLTVETVRAPLREVSTLEGGLRVHRLQGALPPSNKVRAADDNPRVARAMSRLLADGQWDVVHQFSGFVTSAAVIRVARAHDVPVVVSLTDYWWMCRRVTLMTSTGQRCAGPTPVGCARCAAEERRSWKWLARMAPGLGDAFWTRVAPHAPLRGPLGVAREERRPRHLRSILNQSSALVSPSRFLAEVYRRFGVDPHRLRVSRQGVELSVSPLRVPSHTLRVGYLGQIKDHKGVLLLLDAWARLSGPTPRQLTLYGADAGEPAYGRLVRNRIARLENVSWPGSFSRDALWDTLAALDVVVVPSRWDENSPNVILEALGMGVVVVATRRGGIPELVLHERCGLLVEPDSPASLAAALQRFLDEPALVERLRRAGPDAFRHFDDELDDLESTYRDVVAARARPPSSNAAGAAGHADAPSEVGTSPAAAR